MLNRALIVLLAGAAATATGCARRPPAAPSATALAAADAPAARGRADEFRAAHPGSEAGVGNAVLPDRHILQVDGIAPQRVRVGDVIAVRLASGESIRARVFQKKFGYVQVEYEPRPSDAVGPRAGDLALWYPDPAGVAEAPPVAPPPLPSTRPAPAVAIDTTPPPAEPPPPATPTKSETPAVVAPPIVEAVAPAPEPQPAATPVNPPPPTPPTPPASQPVLLSAAPAVPAAHELPASAPQAHVEPDPPTAIQEPVPPRPVPPGPLETLDARPEPEKDLPPGPDLRSLIGVKTAGLRHVDVPRLPPLSMRGFVQAQGSRATAILELTDEHRIFIVEVGSEIPVTVAGRPTPLGRAELTGLGGGPNPNAPQPAPPPADQQSQVILKVVKVTGEGVTVEAGQVQTIIVR